MSRGTFTCLLCKEENYNQNLKVNKFVEKLIAQDLHKYEIESKYQETLNNLEKEVEKIEAILNNHDKVIHEEINELKRQVDLEREILKSQIDERADDLIQQLESYEAKFKTEYKTIVDFEHYNSLVESSRKKLEEYESCLNLFSAKHQEREEKYIESENMIKNLQAEIVELNNRLVSNLSITYKPFRGNMEDLYGQIITKVSESII
jgi:chromosome segregation ATPase